MRAQENSTADSMRSTSVDPYHRPPNGAGRQRGRRHATSGAVLLCMASALACGGEATHGLDEARRSQALGIPSDWWLPWPTGVVPYCYQPSAPASGYPQPGSGSFTTSVQMTEDAIAKYEAIPDADIDFQGGGLCQDWDDYAVGTDTDTLRIVITDDDAATRFCTPGSIAQGERIDDVCSGGHSDEVVVVFGEGYWAPEAGVLHELGHALAFNHEYWRRPGSDDDCDPDATVGASNGITEYDVYSVMNATYCHTRTWLSDLDHAGLAFVYPGPGADKLSVPLSFQLPGVVVTGASDAAGIEFAQRRAGVEEHHYAQAEWSRPTPLGSIPLGTGSSLTLGDALGSLQQGDVRATFTDGFGRTRTSPTTTVRQDPGLFTALVLTAAS